MVLFLKLAASVVIGGSSFLHKALFKKKVKTASLRSWITLEFSKALRLIMRPYIWCAQLAFRSLEFAYLETQNEQQI